MKGNPIIVAIAAAEEIHQLDQQFAARGKVGRFGLTVHQVLAKVTIAPPSVTLPPGGTVDFTATPLDARDHPVERTLAAPSWQSDTTPLVAIDAAGRDLADPDAVASGLP